MSFIPTKSGTFKIGLLDRDGSLSTRVHRELLSNLNCELTQERVDHMQQVIADAVDDIAEDQSVDAPDWAVVIDHNRPKPGHIWVGFQDETGALRSIDDMETEIHRRAVRQML